MTLVSRVLGFVRDIVIARLFGAGTGADAFFVAFKIPNFLRRLFGEGAFAQAFVPVFSEYQTHRDPAEVRTLAGHVAGVFGLVLLAVTAAGVLVAPWLIYLFAPGFGQDPDKYELAVTLLRITFPYLLFIALTAFAGAMLNTRGRFGVPAFTPVLLNLAMIAAALGFADEFAEPVLALAWGVFVGGAIQLLFQAPFLWRIGLLVRPRLSGAGDGVRRIARLMVPALFGVSVTQISLLIDTILASFLETGSISWLYYSDRLMELPLGLFGIALGTVILPALSTHHTRGERARFVATLDWALGWLVVIGFPATLGLLLAPAPILTTLFQYGAFSERDVGMAALSLMAYGAGLIGFMGVKVAAPGYFSRQDTKTPVKVAAIAMVANAILSVALIFPLAHAGLALATAIAAWLNAGLLLAGLRREQVYRPLAGWGRLLGRVAAAGVAMGTVLLWLAGDTATWLEASALERAGRVTVLIGGAATVYVGVLWLLGWRPAWHPHSGDGD